jgi:hypothetical protein
MSKVSETTVEFEAYEKELDTCTQERRDEIRREALVCDQLMIYSWEGRYEDRAWAALNNLVGRVIIKAAGRL